ncbi:MAG TPA: Type 1 glutamine amidotransferase-like domain-containing protein [Candidatus Angelobacter sp.]|nr:Type 1 glutamine amidotransferase-like domain-containing protein [Candidatus Angelobacter sp.]
MRPLYLLADSQLLFQHGENSFSARLRAELPENPKAAYVGASNCDKPEFYDLFRAAMEVAGVCDCHMLPSQLAEQDRAFLEEASLILLAGGETEHGWRTFEQNGLKELLLKKRYDGAVLAGVSAGAVQLGRGALSNAAQPAVIEMFGFAPFYVAAHDDEQDWWDLRALVNMSPTESRGIGIPFGGGAIYFPDGGLEPISKPLIELVKEDGQVKEHLLLPEQ